MRTFIPSRTSLIALLLTVCMLDSAAPAPASVACPVMLYDGKTDGDTISVTFMNKSKVPIRQLELYCTSLQGQGPGRFDCHTEAGVFFPGTPYTISFSSPNKIPRAIRVSVKAALLDGYIWTSAHDQPCRDLKLVKLHN